MDERKLTLNSVHYRAKAVKPRPKSKPEAEAIARDVKSIRILIVDDVPDEPPRRKGALRQARVRQRLHGRVGQGGCIVKAGLRTA